MNNFISTLITPAPPSLHVQKRNGKIGVSPIGLYTFDPLVERLMVKEHLSRMDAEVLFHDMLLFLDLCGRNDPEKGAFSPTENIDAAWHHFILFTKEYARFCHRYYGHFIHHTPFTFAKKAEMKTKGQEGVLLRRTIELGSGLIS